PLGLQARLELLEGQLEGAEAPGLQDLADELVLAAHGVDVEVGERQDVEAVLGGEAEPSDAALEEDGPDLGPLVLQREVDVAGAVDPEVRDLALDPQPAEAGFELVLDRPGELGDRVDPPAGVEGELLRQGEARQSSPACRRAAASVLRISMATVIGPTPPGTGVIARTRGLTEAKSTSPASLPSGSRLTPTAMTAASAGAIAPLTPTGRPAPPGSPTALRWDPDRA